MVKNHLCPRCGGTHEEHVAVIANRAKRCLDLLLVRYPSPEGIAIAPKAREQFMTGPGRQMVNLIFEELRRRYSSPAWPKDDCLANIDLVFGKAVDDGFGDAFTKHLQKVDPGSNN